MHTDKGKTRRTKPLIDFAPRFYPQLSAFICVRQDAFALDFNILIGRGLNLKTFPNRDEGDELDNNVSVHIPFIPFIRVNTGFCFGVELRCYPCRFRGIRVRLSLRLDNQKPAPFTMKWGLRRFSLLYNKS
jgi:hypothetical protein